METAADGDYMLDSCTATLVFAATGRVLHRVSHQRLTRSNSYCAWIFIAIPSVCCLCVKFFFLCIKLASLHLGEAEETCVVAQCNLHHLTCGKSCCQWHETKRPLLLPSAHEESTKKLCCNHFCLWHYMCGGRGETGDLAFNMERTHGAYLHMGSKCGYLTCWVMGIVNIIGRTHKDVGWSIVICPGAPNAKKCMNTAVVAPLGFSVLGCFPCSRSTS